jgi:hypothetical protein
MMPVPRPANMRGLTLGPRCLRLPEPIRRAGPDSIFSVEQERRDLVLRPCLTARRFDAQDAAPGVLQPVHESTTRSGVGTVLELSVWTSLISQKTVQYAIAASACAPIGSLSRKPHEAFPIRRVRQTDRDCAADRP